MKSAGLNPILAAKLGGASTPQGSQFKSPNILGGAVTAYQQYKANEANVENVEAQTKLTNAKTVEQDQKNKGEGGTYSALETLAAL